MTGTKYCQVVKKTMVMAIVVTSLLLATPSSATVSSKTTSFHENSESHTTQLRGSDSNTDSSRLLQSLTRQPTSRRPTNKPTTRSPSQNPTLARYDREESEASLLPCNASEDCPSGEYCAGFGYCIRRGSCSELSDCSSFNNLVAYPACVGTITCRERRCSKICGGRPFPRPDIGGGGLDNPDQSGGEVVSIVIENSTDSDRFTDNRRPTRLPVSPGIAEGVNADNLPCLIDAVCELNELSILCGFLTTSLLEWNRTGSDNFFMEEGEGMFFAPLDEAFDDPSGSLLSNIISEDLADPAILENTLLYHVSPVDESRNDTDIWFLNDPGCNGSRLMANGQTTDSRCSERGEIQQIGWGNRPMRTLPQVIGEGIESCDGTVALYLVNSLILPPLPLSRLPSQERECPPCIGYLNGERCEYEHIYTGCTWEELQCGSTESCNCSDGIWMCAPQTVVVCGTFPEGLPWGYACDPNEELPTPPVESEQTSGGPECPRCSGYQYGNSCELRHTYRGCNWDELYCGWSERCDCEDDGIYTCVQAGMEACLDIPEGLPWGQDCDPTEELPTPSQADVALESKLELSDECPPSEDFESCDGYQRNLVCEYNYAFDGCDWSTLACRPILRCECDMFGNGFWGCLSETRMYCEDPPGYFPELFPTNGARCVPGAPLPYPPPPPPNTAVTSEGNEEVLLSLMNGGLP